LCPLAEMVAGKSGQFEGRVLEGEWLGLLVLGPVE
jgi:hypothetical protein